MSDDINDTDDLLRELNRLFQDFTERTEQRFAHGRFILDGHTPVPEPDLITWARWLQTAERVVKQEHVSHYQVSTVFLGLDHNFRLTGDPILFETMVFNLGNNEAEYQTRCSTWEQAEEMHREAVAWTRRLASS